MKAISILVVVYIHSERWGIQNSLIQAFSAVTRFAVPTFLFVSGLLLSRPEPIPFSELARRLQRIGPPYLVASLVAFLFGWVVFGERLSIGEMGLRLAVGGASTIYYFIPILVAAIAIAVSLSGHPRALAVLGVGLIVATLLVESGYLMRDDYGRRGLYFWELRNPLRWWGYFFAGWLSRPGCAALLDLSRSRRVGLGVAALLFPAFTFLYTLRASEGSRGLVPGTLVLLNNYGTILAMLLLGSLAPERRSVRWLSGATYPLYLYHFFVVQLVQEAPLSDLAVIPVAFVAGLAATSLFVVGTRRALGPLAPAVIG